VCTNSTLESADSEAVGASAVVGSAVGKEADSEAVGKEGSAAGFCLEVEGSVAEAGGSAVGSAAGGSAVAVMEAAEDSAEAVSVVMGAAEAAEEEAEPARTCD
jgi:hypothetical protein